MTDSIFTLGYDVTFGDCDPAGLVFYPNMFALQDRAFQAYLTEKVGGHAGLCEAIGSKGLGLIKAECNYLSPIIDGDQVIIDISEIEWGNRSFVLKYSGRVGERAVFEGKEKRTMFVVQDGRLRAGDIQILRAKLGG